MGEMIGNWTDLEIPGLNIIYNCRLTDVIPGVRDAISGHRLGPPIEPDEEIYTFSVKEVCLYSVTIDLNLLDVDGEFGESEELIDEVVKQVFKLIDDKLGIKEKE